jgi:hypothetical protein
VHLNEHVHLVAHRRADLAKWLKAFSHLFWLDVLALPPLSVNVKRPDLHSADTAFEQLTSELVSVVKEAVKVFVAATSPSGWQPPVGRSLPP